MGAFHCKWDLTLSDRVPVSHTISAAFGCSFMLSDAALCAREVICRQKRGTRLSLAELFWEANTSEPWSYIRAVVCLIDGWALRCLHKLPERQARSAHAGCCELTLSWLPDALRQEKIWFQWYAVNFLIYSALLLTKLTCVFCPSAALLSAPPRSSSLPCQCSNTFFWG